MGYALGTNGHWSTLLCEITGKVARPALASACSYIVPLQTALFGQFRELHNPPLSQIEKYIYTCLHEEMKAHIDYPGEGREFTRHKAQVDCSCLQFACVSPRKDGKC